jgi:CRISPR-associated protein Csd1
VELALAKFPEQVKDKVNEGNIAFRVNDIRLHEHDDVYNAIIERYERDQEALIKGDKKVCSICGKSEFPVIDKPHGYIKSVPDGQEGKNVLVSYNEKAFESYGLVGNFNSSICTNCAKNYVEGLNYLLTNGYIKDVSKHTNRKSLGLDTAVVFWTREPDTLDEMDWFDKPDAGRVANLIESIANAKNKTAVNFKPNQFYSLTLSGAAARIAIRDWIEISIDQYRQNIARWFDDVKIKYYDADAKELQFFIRHFINL